MSINGAKWTFLLSYCASKMTSSLSTAAFASGFFFRLWHRDELVYQVVMRHRSKSFACHVVFLIFWAEKIPIVALWIHEFHYTTLNCVGIFVGCNFRLCSHLLGLLHGMVGVIGLSSFFLAFLRIYLYSSSPGSIK